MTGDGINWQRWGVRSIREAARELTVGLYVALDCPRCGRVRLCRTRTHVECDKCDYRLSVSLAVGAL